MLKIDKKLAPFYDADKDPSKRTKALLAWLDGAQEEEVKILFEKDFSQIYNCFLSTLQSYESLKPGKTPKQEDVLKILKVLENFFRYTPELIRKKWQFRSISTLLEQLLDIASAPAYRQYGFKLLLMFIENLDCMDDALLRTLQSALDFTPFVRSHPANLPSKVQAFQKLAAVALLPGTAPPAVTEQDALDRLETVLSHASDGPENRFALWLGICRKILFPVLFPQACVKCGLMEASNDLGFQQGCPDSLLSVVATHVTKWCIAEGRSCMLYEDGNNVNMVIEIMKQTFSHRDATAAAKDAALSMYAAWADGVCRPPQMAINGAASVNKFVRKMLRQGSSLLQAHAMDADIHRKLCIKMANIVNNLTRTLDKQMDTKTWEMTLKMSNLALVAVASMHKSHRIPTMINEGGLQSSLEQETAETLFAVHVRARGLTEEQWKQFVETAAECCSCIYLVYQWKRVMVYFTREVLSHLYGAGRPKAPIARDTLFDSDYEKKASTNPPELHPLSFKIEEVDWKVEAVMAYWERFLNVFDDPSNIDNPDCFAVVMSGIATVTDMLLEPYWGSAGATERPPRDTILGLIGPWLIRACERSKGYSSGTSEAFRAFSRIVCSYGREDDIVPQYAAEFYRVMHFALMGEDPDVVNAIFLHARDFWVCDMPGNSVVVRSMLSALVSFVHANTTSMNPMMTRSSVAMQTNPIDMAKRAAALHLSINLVFVVSAFEQLLLPSIPGEAPQSSNFGTLGIMCQTMLERFVREDPVAALQIRGLMGLALYMVDELGRTSSKTKHVKECMKTIQDFCRCSIDNVAFVALSVMNDLAVWSKSLAALNGAIVNDLMHTLCYSITSLIPQQRKILVIQHLATLRQWVVYTTPHVINEEHTCTLLYETACACLAQSVAPEIQEAAHMLLCYLISCVSTVFPRLDQHAAAKPRPYDTSKELHFAIPSNLLVTFREGVGEEVGKVIVLARDGSGLHEWQATLAADRPCRAKVRQREEGSESKETAAAESVDNNSGESSGGVATEGSTVPYTRDDRVPPAFTESANSLVVDMLSHLHHYATLSFPDCSSPATCAFLSASASVSPGNATRLEKIQEKMNDIRTSETEISEANRKFSENCNSATPPKRPSEPMSNLQHVRLLLAQLCIVSPWGSLDYHNIDATQEYMAALQHLDQTPAREAHVVGFVCRHDADTTVDSDSLNSFMDGFGWSSPNPGDIPDESLISANDRFYSDVMNDVWLRCFDDFGDVTQCISAAALLSRQRLDLLQSHGSPGLQTLTTLLNVTAPQVTQLPQSESASSRATESRDSSSTLGSPSARNSMQINFSPTAIPAAIPRWCPWPRVYVVWWACRRKFMIPPQPQGTPLQRIFIVVTPLKNRLYRIEINFEWKPARAGAGSEVPAFGPLLHGMVVSAPQLPALLRLTTINANKFLQRQFDKCDANPWIARSVHLRNIISCFSSPQTNNREIIQMLVTGAAS